MRVGSQRHAPAALTFGKETRYQLYRILRGPQDRCGRLWEISPPPGFDPQNVQLVTSRCSNPPVIVNMRVISRSGDSVVGVEIRLRTGRFGV